MYFSPFRFLFSFSSSILFILLIKKLFPLCFQDLTNFEPEDDMEHELGGELLDLKENSKLTKKCSKWRRFGYIEIRSWNPNIYELVESSIISFPTTWLEEASFSAVFDIFTKKWNKLHLNEKAVLRSKLNKTFTFDYLSLCNKLKTVYHWLIFFYLE